MILRRRNLMVSKEHSNVVCLKASTKQWIDTGIVPDLTTVVEVDFGGLKYSSVYFKILGVYVGSNNVNNYCITGVSSYFGYSIGGGQVAVKPRDDDIKRTKIRMSCTEYYIDDVLCANYDASFSTTYTMALFAAKNGVSTVYGRNRLTELDCYGLKVWKAGELIANYIPWLDNDGRPCMLDTVSGQPFYNRGTGEFGYELTDGTIVSPT